MTAARKNVNKLRSGDKGDTLRGDDGSEALDSAIQAALRDRATHTGVQADTTVMFTPAGTGAAVRTVRAKERDIVSARDFTGVVGDGINNDTAGIQAALTELTAAGGDLYLPPTASGYLITDNITVPNFVGLFGSATKIPVNTGYGVADVNDNRGTTILVTGTVNPAITLMGNTALRGIRFFYPGQTDTNPPVTYPATIKINTACSDTLIENVAIYNAYDGIDAWRQHARLTLRNVDIWCARYGAQIDYSVDVDRVENLHIWPFWSQATGAGKMTEYSAANGIGLRLGRADGIIVDGLFCMYKLYGLSLETTAAGTTYGHFSNIDIETCQECVRISGMNAENGVTFTNFKLANGVSAYVTAGVGMMITGGCTGPVILVGGNFWGLGQQNSIHNNAPTGGLMVVKACSFYKGVAAQGMIKISNVASPIIMGCTFGPISAGGYHLDLNGMVAGKNIVFDKNFASGGATVNNPGGATVVGTNYAWN